MKYQTTNQSLVQFQETSRDYRTEIPNIILDLVESGDLPKNAYMLYSVYRRIAGQNGRCWIGTRTLAEKCQLRSTTITKMKKLLSMPISKLGGKSLIQVTPGDPKKEEADTVTIIDIWPENHKHFKNKLTCTNPEYGGVSIRSTGVCQSGVLKKEPSKKKPCKNSPPPLTPPLARVVKKTDPEPLSLRSEEDGLAAQKETQIHPCLEQTELSSKDKLRLTKEYSEQQVADAIKVSKTQTVKKSLMALLVNILNNPEKWQNPPDRKIKPTKPEDLIEYNRQKAIDYNERLKKCKGIAKHPVIKPGEKKHTEVSIAKIAHENDDLIKENGVVIITDGFLFTISLKSSNFAKDIERATRQLR